MLQTLTTGILLTVTRCWCGLEHAVPTSLRNEQLRQFNEGWKNVMGLYCPVGHSHQPAGEPECVRLKRVAKQEQDRLLQRVRQERKDADRQRVIAQEERERANAAERRRAAQQGVTTKLKKRVAAGVCPCCKRSFKDLSRHMAGQHPEYGKDE